MEKNTALLCDRTLLGGRDNCHVAALARRLWGLIERVIRSDSSCEPAGGIFRQYNGFGQNSPPVRHLILGHFVFGFSLLYEYTVPNEHLAVFDRLKPAW